MSDRDIKPENTEGSGLLARKRTPILGFDADICDRCHSTAKGSDGDVSIGRCFECARYACTCWLEKCEVEGFPKGKRYYFCVDGVPGSCAHDPR